MKISLSFNVLALVLALGSIAPTAAQMPALDDSRHSMLREAMLGVLPSGSQAVSVDAARGQCQPLPNPPVGEGIEGPHGDSLLSTKCKVVDYASIPAVGGSTWALAQYQWTSVFTAEDATRGPLARDTAIEKEVVLFEGIENGRLRPRWHARFEDGPYAIWRSVTPSLAPSSASGGVLLSVESCVKAPAVAPRNFSIAGVAAPGGRFGRPGTTNCLRVRQDEFCTGRRSIRAPFAALPDITDRGIQTVARHSVSKCNSSYKAAILP